MTWERANIRRELLKTMTLKHALIEISNAVYQATRILEELEQAGRLTGGHQARDAVATYAQEELRNRWKEKS